MKAWLMGHEFDLQYLADLLPSGSTRVTKEDGDFFLSSVELDDLLPGAYLHEVAGKLLTRANGLARVQNPGFQPVRLSGRYTDDERGHAVLGGSSIVIRAHIQASGSVLRSDGEARQPMVPFGPRRLALATSSQNVDEALAVMGQIDPLDWTDLYKVFEIVCDDARPGSITRLGWATRVEVDAFRASANRPDVSGTAARHARTSGGTRDTG